MAKKNAEHMEKIVGQEPALLAQKKNADLWKKREQKFAKTNDFLQNFVAQMSGLELRLADYIMATAYYAEDSPLEYTLNIADFCKVAGIDYDSGRNYEQVREALKRMRAKAEWAKCDDGSGDEVLVGMVNKIRISRRNGTVHLWLDEDMRKYVFNAKKAWAEKGIPFTEFVLLYMLPLKSRYARLLYEQLKSWEAAGEHYWTISQLQEILGSNYDRFSNFRQKVLDIAVKQINEHTDLLVSYEASKEGRAYKYIYFYIEKKSDTKLLEVQGRNQHALDGELEGQISLFDDM